MSPGAVDHALHESDDEAAGRLDRQRQIGGHRHDVLDADADVDLLQPEQAAAEQQGTRDQHERHRDLGAATRVTLRRHPPITSDRR